MEQPSKNNLGSNREFKALFDAHYEQIKNFLYYKSGDLQQAEDLTQEVFMILWQRRQSVQADKVKSYLYTIANNLFLNQVKHQKVVMKFNSQPVEDSTHHTPQFLMEEQEFEERLQKAISALAEKNREVFLMNRIEKLTYKEIAERLNISVKAVEKRMHKALADLRQIATRI